MDENLGILFLHHEINDIVRNNLLSVQQQNPGALIVTMSAGEPMPNGYSLDATPALRELHTIKPRTCADWLVCSWFMQRKEQCKKWWIIEWDVYCTMSVRDYYRAVWHYPFVTAKVNLRYREPQWAWFRQVRKMPPEHRPFAMGAVPFLYLMDEAVLEKVCTTLLKQPFPAGNCELRFATIANGLGFAPCGFSPPNDQITWLPLQTLRPGRGIFHPVKFLAGDTAAGATG